MNHQSKFPPGFGFDPGLACGADAATHHKFVRTDEFEAPSPFTSGPVRARPLAEPAKARRTSTVSVLVTSALVGLVLAAGSLLFR
jgi:hypothetical protein